MAAPIVSFVLAAQPWTNPDALVAAYAAGDYDVVRRAIPTPDDYYEALRTFAPRVTTWHWSRPRAAFTLEVAFVAVEQNWPASVQREEIRRAARFLESRNRRPGVDPRDDQFEILAHLALLASLQNALQVDAVDAYLQSIGSRVAAEPRGDGRPRLIEPRFLLIGAIAQEQRTTPGTLARLRRATEAPLRIEPTGAVGSRVAGALRRLEAAAAYPANQPEATVRRAFLLHRIGRDKEALASLDATPETDDAVVAYWGRLSRGRILEALDRPAAAVRAYEEAAALWPDAQAPAAALAALHTRQNRRTEALRWTRRTLQAPLDALDPWWFYWFGDGRLAEEYRARMREAMR